MEKQPKFDSETGRELLSGSLKVGETVYIPIVDTISCGFIIEEMKIIKLIPPSGNPKGFPDVKWSYGNISSYSQRKMKFGHLGQIYYVNNVFRTIAECIEKLDSHKLKMIESANFEKQKWIDQVENLKMLMRETQVESKESIKFQNKKLALLHQLDITGQLTKRYLID
jgi:hypothetical protein